MKASSVAALTLVGAAAATPAGDAAAQVLTDITAAVGVFDTVVQGYNGGPITSLSSASAKVSGIVTTGAKTITNGDKLALLDATGLVSGVGKLQTSLDALLSGLEGKITQIAAAGGCAETTSQLKSQSDSASALQNAIKSKAPAGTESIADSEGGKVTASINKTLAKFQSDCKGGSAAPAASAPASAPAAAAPAAPAAAASSAPAAAAPAAPVAPTSDTATATYGGAASEPATSSTAPAPATYTGAASTVSVGGLTFAAIAAFWAL